MIDPRFEDLLNQEIDSQVTDEQRNALREHLRASPEAESYRDDLQKLLQVLQDAKEIEPPATLRDDILARIEQEKAITRTASLAEAQSADTGVTQSPGVWQSLLVSLRSGFRGSGALRRRELFAFAGGAIIGIALLLVATDRLPRMSSIPESAFPGAMVPLATVEEAPVVDSAVLQGAGLEARVEISRSASFLFANIQVQSPQPVALEIHFDPQALAVRGVTQEKGGFPLQAALSSSQVQIQHEGSNTYHLTMEAQGSESTQFRIRLIGDGQVLEKTLRTVE